ncbi:MAG: RNase adapter RapZ [Lachnospiraceae bacterium]|nr:RNase adapter RapZ [Lachnospiraceae bacterium]
MKPLIVTGMSGAGKHTAISVLEDFGYNCVDNLPVPLLKEFVDLHFSGRIEGMEKNGRGGEDAKYAVVIDIRNGKNLGELASILDELDADAKGFEILFLDAEDGALVKRYKETRHTHPISGASRVSEGIEAERRAVAFLKERADFVVDTTHLLTRDLREALSQIFLDKRVYKNLQINVLSFGFKYGIPQDADLVFDVRFLPNPFYDLNLRPLTGNDEPIRQFVMKEPAAHTFIEKLYDLISFLIPYYIKEGKNQLVICVGCTGGKHRSVCLANALFDKLQDKDAPYGLRIEHRDIDKDAKRGK